MENCINIMASFNFNFAVSFVSRNLNSEAHRLYGLAKSCDSRTWTDDHHDGHSMVSPFID